MERTEILKKCRAYNNSNDLLYYLIGKKEYDIYAAIYAPCNYLFSNNEDQFFGTGIYMSENNFGNELLKEFTARRTICGIPMIKTPVKHNVNNELGTLDNNEIRELPVLHRLHSEPRFHTPFYPGYYCFECDDVIDIIDPKIAFMDLYRRDESFCSFMTGLADYFDVRPEQLGVFGSVAMGCDSAGDYDIIFYGNKKELKRIRDLITEMNSIHGVPRVGGRPIPFRFIFDGIFVDAFYVYEDSELGSLHTAQTIKTNVPFRCSVIDDSSGLQVVPFLGVDSKDFSSLIVMESYFHSVFKTGNIIEGCGDLLEWEHNGVKENVMLCKDPYRQIKDWSQYFLQYQ